MFSHSSSILDVETTLSKSIFRVAVVWVFGLLLMVQVSKGETQSYIIYPVSHISQPASQELDSFIAKSAGSKENVYASFRDGKNIPRYWVASLSEHGARLIKGHELVEEIHINGVVGQSFTSNVSLGMETPISSASVAYATQRRAPAELTVLSQPTGRRRGARYDNYVYRTDGSKEVFIYHAEFGINGAHIDFNDRRVEWVYTRMAINEKQNTETESSDGNGHSTCSASKAVGNDYGASKHSTLVVVKMPDYTEGSMGEITNTIHDHIVYHQRQKTSVVSISWGSDYPMPPSPTPYPRFWKDMLKDFTELVSLGVPVVVSAGNDALERDAAGNLRLLSDKAPAVFAQRDDLPLVVVGNCDNDGHRYKESSRPGKLPSLRYNRPLFAPGTDIHCADVNSNTASRVDTGTSFSAPLVAGVIADLLRIGTLRPPFTSSTLEELYLEASWNHNGAERVIWNMVDAIHNPPKYGIVNSITLNHTAALTNDAVFGGEESR